MMTANQEQANKQKHKNQNLYNHNNSERNLCLQEQKLSLKCINTVKDSDECEAYFENYRRCKKFWFSVQQQRRRDGITPEIPPVEERAKYKEEHMQKLDAVQRKYLNKQL